MFTSAATLSAAARRWKLSQTVALRQHSDRFLLLRDSTETPFRTAAPPTDKTVCNSFKWLFHPNLLSDSLVIVQMVISTKYKFRINYLSF